MDVQKDHSRNRNMGRTIHDVWCGKSSMISIILFNRKKGSQAGTPENLTTSSLFIVWGIGKRFSRVFNDVKSRVLSLSLLSESNLQISDRWIKISKYETLQRNQSAQDSNLWPLPFCSDPSQSFWCPWPVGQDNGIDPGWPPLGLSRIGCWEKRLEAGKCRIINFNL